MGYKITSTQSGYGVTFSESGYSISFTKKGYKISESIGYGIGVMVVGSSFVIG